LLQIVGYRLGTGPHIIEGEVLGDNRPSSSDSRQGWLVPEKNIIGRAEFIYWPVKRLRFINE